MSDLKPCPCGKVPEKLYVHQIEGPYYFTYGSCCMRWRTPFAVYDGETPEQKSDEIWNEAPRGEQR